MWDYFILVGIILIGITVIAVILFAVLRKKKRPQTKQNVTHFADKFERKYYRFHNGLEACQEQLGLDQNEEFSILLSTVDLEMGGMDMEKLNDVMFNKQGMRKLLAVILINDDGSALNPDQRELAIKLKEDEVDTVMEDFFILNPKKKALFEIIKLAAVSQMMSTPGSSGGGSKKAG